MPDRIPAPVPPAAPTVGRCGHRLSDWGSGYGALVCALPAGHAGWHRSDEGTEWGTASPDLSPAQQLAEMVGPDTASALIQAGWDALRSATAQRPDLVHPGVADYVATTVILGIAPILLAAGRTAAAADILKTHVAWSQTGKLPQSYLDGVADAASIADDHAEGTDHAG